MGWEEAMEVLGRWAGRHAVVVPFLEPGISLWQSRGELEVEHPKRGVVRLAMPGMGVALRRATFIEAGWVPGREDQGLSVVQGGVRVDVFVDGD